MASLKSLWRRAAGWTGQDWFLRAALALTLFVVTAGTLSEIAMNREMGEPAFYSESEIIDEPAPGHIELRIKGRKMRQCAYQATASIEDHVIKDADQPPIGVRYYFDIENWPRFDTGTINEAFHIRVPADLHKRGNEFRVGVTFHCPDRPYLAQVPTMPPLQGPRSTRPPSKADLQRMHPSQDVR